MVEPTVAAAGFEASPQQKRLWHLAGGALAGLRTVAEVEVRGPLPAAVLERALAALVERHEVLRTALRLPEGLSVPVQVVADAGTVDLAEVVPQDAGEGARERAAEATWRRLASGTADGTSADATPQAAASVAASKPLHSKPAASNRDTPRLTVRRLRLGEDRHLLWLALPAFAADRGGVLRLLRELAAACDAAERGAAAAGDDEAVQYADLAGWLNGFLEDDETVEGRDFWRRRIAALRPSPRPVGGHGGRSDGEGGRRDALERRLDVAVVRHLERTAAAAGGGTEDLLLALWWVLLARQGDELRAAVSVAFEGRDYQELEATPGPLERYLPLVAELMLSTPLAEAVAAIRAARDEAAQRQECFPWETVEGGLLDHGFSFRPLPPPFAGGGRTWTVRRTGSHGEPRLAELEVETAADVTTLRLLHDGRRLDAATAGRWLDRFVTLLAAAESRCPVGALQILPDGERRELLAVAGSGVPAASPPLPGRIAATARERPEAAALRCGGAVLTYRDLDRRARHVAARLRSLGVGAGDVVPLLFEASPELLVSIVAAWYAGAAYACLEPGQPAARLAAMLGDLDRRVLLTAPPADAAVAALAGAWDGEVLRVDTDAAVGGDRPATAPRAPQPGLETPGAALAYVLFTSGSTGRPKPVAVEHRQLARYVDAVADRLGLPSGSRYGAVTSLAADLGHTSVFSALASGGCVHLLGREEASDPELFARRFAEHPVDCLKIVPGHLEALLAVSDPARLLPAKVLVLGGEALPAGLVRRLAAIGPGLRILNHYGPTETTVGATTWEAAAGDDDAEGTGGTVPIGRPLDGVAVHVVEPSLRLAPFGVPGELWITGAGVSRGYLGRPAATAERFVPDPFSAVDGGRAYRTGDRGCRLADGELVFRGRLDRQVKLRGFRIEPGEVEAALATHPAVDRAVVLAREDAAGVRLLVAYPVVPAGGLEPGELRRHLEARLPDFMIPAAFVVVEGLPRTANGKLDLAALPAPGRADGGGSAPYVEPRGEAERRLAAIWADVLGVERVGRDDNFFALGGDSILSIQVIARSNAAGLHLTPRQIFTHQTVAALAAVADPGAPAAEAATRETGPVPLTPVQRRFLDRDPDDPHHYNQSLLLAPRRPLAAAPLAAALRAVAAGHDALRLRFERGDGGWRQRAATDSGVKLAVVDLAALPGVRRAAALEAAGAALQAGFDLARGPLLRAVLLRAATAGGEDRLLLLAHHLVVDGVSWRILLDDLSRAHRTAEAGEVPEAPQPGTPFRRWAERLAEQAAAGLEEAEVDYWLDPRRKRARPLPADGDGPDRQRDAASLARSLGAGETSELLRRAAGGAGRGGPQPYLLAALGRALHTRCGDGPVLVDLEGHGRENLFTGVDPSRTAGWFTAVFPLLVDLPGAAGPARDPAADLAAVRRALAALPRHGIGYGQMRWLDAGGAAARLAAQPQAQVIFNYLGRLDRALAADAPFAAAGEPVGAQRSPRQRRRYLLEVTAEVVDGCLRSIWTWGANRLRRGTVEGLADAFLDALRGLLAVPADGAPAGGGPDVSLIDLDDAQLEDLAARLSGGGGTA